MKSRRTTDVASLKWEGDTLIIKTEDDQVWKFYKARLRMREPAIHWEPIEVTFDTASVMAP